MKANSFELDCSKYWHGVTLWEITVKFLSVHLMKSFNSTNLNSYQNTVWTTRIFMGQLEGTHFTCIYTVQKGSKTNWTPTKVTFSINVQFEFKHVLSSMSACLNALSFSRRDWLIRHLFWCDTRTWGCPAFLIFFLQIQRV